jgi:hypothetical protein
MLTYTQRERARRTLKTVVRMEKPEELIDTRP